MADEAKTTAELLDALADNTVGGITPQDLRDLLVTVHGVYGGLYATDTAGSQSVDSSAPVVLDQFVGEMSNKGVTLDPATDTITVDVAGVYRLSFSVEYVTNDTGALFTFEVLKNGAPLDLASSVQHGPSVDRFQANAEQLVDLVAGDALQLRVSSTDAGAKTVDVKNASFAVRKVG